MRKLKLNRKGVSAVIAVLLMIAIAVAASILVYVWSMGLIGTLQTGGGQQTKEQVILEAYDWMTTTSLKLYVRNVGSTNVNITAVYVTGPGITGASASGLGTLTIKSSTTITVTVSGTPTSGQSYTVKIVTSTGGVFSYSVICGSSG